MEGLGSISLPFGEEEAVGEAERASMGGCGPGTEGEVAPESTTDSDSSDSSASEATDPYRRKFQLLLERCEVLQEDNERLLHRLRSVRALLRRGRCQRRFLMARLDTKGDDWREAVMTVSLGEEEEAAALPGNMDHRQGQTSHKRQKSSSHSKSASSRANTPPRKRPRKKPRLQQLFPTDTMRLMQ